MTTKKFYVVTHRYGIEFCNDHDTLFRFASKTERDEFAEENAKAEAITRDEARRIFGDAFRYVGDCHDTPDMRDWIAEDDGTTCEFFNNHGIYADLFAC